MSENIQHPKHYNIGRIEVIEVIEDWGLNFNCGNVIKYVGRADIKMDAIQDLKKAFWYLTRELVARKGVNANELIEIIENIYRYNISIPLILQNLSMKKKNCPGEN